MKIEPERIKAVLTAKWRWGAGMCQGCGYHLTTAGVCSAGCGAYDAVTAHNEARISEIHKDLGHELRDPCGTIWQECARQQKVIEDLEAKIEELS